MTPVRLRTLAREVIESAVSGADEVVLVCATDREARHSRAPIGQQVGEELLAAVHLPVSTRVVGWEADVDECRALGGVIGSDSGRARRALIVVADGCATRGEKAPGHLDERSLALDRTWLEALGGVEPR